MNTSIISGCHSLELIPVDRLSRFARVGSRAHIIIIESSDPACEIPGSLKVSTSVDNGVIKKKITFDRAGVSSAETDRLNIYVKLHLIAIYIDESGNRRVSGSPDHPLAFRFSISEGSYVCTLEGSDTEEDAFM